MRAPDRQLVGNLRFTRTGTVWADFLLQPLPYGFRPAKDKEITRRLHQALLRALPGESLLLGISSGLDPMAVVERMVAGIDLATHKDWALEVEATVHTLNQIQPGQRLYWLSVPLGDSAAGGKSKEWWRSAVADLRDQMALPRQSVPDNQIEHRQTQVKKLLQIIPAPFRARPATPAQMLWVNLHAAQRGLFLDVDAPDPEGGDLELMEELLAPRAASALPNVLLDEGGQTELSRKELRGWNPHERRYLKVVQAQHGGQAVTSCQSFLVLTDVPAGGMRFPGGTEFFGFADHLGFDVDWALRLHVVSSDAVVSKNQRALVNLNEQFTQREGELSHGLSELDQAAADLAQYASLLQKDKLEVEVQATTIFAVGAPTIDEVTEQARALADYFASAEFKLSQPLGGQSDLWWAMTPGAPTSKLVREFAQITTSRALSAAVPITSSELGDRAGPLFALNISNGRPGVVLHDIAGAATRDVSGACAFAGELGSGKALALDTELATPSGWTTMARIGEGDIVFDEQGQPTRVAAVSEVMSQRPCYRVEFSDGSVIVADAEHSWTTLPDPERSIGRERDHGVRRSSGRAVAVLEDPVQGLVGPDWAGRFGSMCSTWDLAESVRAYGERQVSHAIPASQPLQLPEQDLPIDPYVLGSWLGEGPGLGATAGVADSELLGFTEQFKALGVLTDKHVPDVYLRAGLAQREALLAGIVAVDGLAGPEGTVWFDSTNSRLARAVHELAVSVGLLPTITANEVRLAGWNCGSTFRVSWVGPGPAGGLQRQRTDQQPLSWVKTQMRQRLRYITGVTAVASVPVKCIRVESESRLYLAGRAMIATHNSSAIKSLAGAVVDRGGILIAADRTAMGEYEVWANEITDAVVVNVAEPHVSLDPLRLFGTKRGSRVAQSFLTPLLNVAPTSTAGVLMSDVLDPPYLQMHDITGLGHLVDHLAGDCDLSGAKDLARLMNLFARGDLGQVIFDAELPPLPLDTPAIVIRTHTLELPSKSELETEHLFQQMRLEKIFGRACYALIASIAREVCFADRSRLGAFVVDEAHFLVSSPEGEREIIDFVRDGRKHSAAVILGSHDPEADFGSPTLRGLIPTRILMRHRDKKLARRGLDWLDLDPNDTELVDMVTQNTSPVGPNGVEEGREGEAFMRDSSGNIGRIKVMLPSRPERNQAARTSPPQMATGQ